MSPLQVAMMRARSTPATVAVPPPMTAPQYRAPILPAIHSREPMATEVMIGSHTPALAPSISIDRIKKVAADFYQISIPDIMSHRSHAFIVRARHVAMYLAKEMTSASFPKIGRSFNRHHSTVLVAVAKIAEWLKVDTELAAEIETIRARIVS